MSSARVPTSVVPPAPTSPVAAPAPHPAVPRRASAPEASAPLVGDRLWLDFVNTDDTRRPDGTRRPDVLLDFDLFVGWLEAADVLDPERAAGLRRRAIQQPAGAAAALVDARRVRATLRALAERGAASAPARADALAAINRVLSRSTVTRRVEERPDGTYARAFVTIGDAFAGLTVPVVDSAADALVRGELPRVRRCSDPRCPRVFLDTTKNGRRRWCDMATCGNRAKAARHRRRKVLPDGGGGDSGGGTAGGGRGLAKGEGRTAWPERRDL